MVSYQEEYFVNQTAAYHALGGDLEALVHVELDLDGRSVYIDDETEIFTLLFCAAREGWCSALSWLLERGADVHLGEPSNGYTPLHMAALGDRREAALLLLDAGARVNEPFGGLSALHLAAGRSDPRMCRLLVSRGASLDARCDLGRDPEAFARGYGRTTTAAFLAAVRAAGGWLPWLNVPRKELLALRQQLPALRERGRAAPSSSVRAHERLFLRKDVPDDVFSHVLAFWRSDRDD